MTYIPLFLGDLIPPGFLGLRVCQAQQNQPFPSSFRHASLLSLFRDKCVILEMNFSLPSPLPPSLPGSQDLKFTSQKDTASASQGNLTGQHFHRDWHQVQSVLKVFIFFPFCLGNNLPVGKCPDSPTDSRVGFTLCLYLCNYHQLRDDKHSHYPGNTPPCSFLVSTHPLKVSAFLISIFGQDFIFI